MKIKDDHAFNLSEDVLFQEVSGETVLLDLASEQYFGLDEVGTRIWQLLNDRKTISEMVDILLNEYEVQRGPLEADVRELLRTLMEAGLIRAEETGG
ncbi:MAG: PqqD family protein [Gammaproteobacteria bacterium]|nr:PqqD family protein [Gammaproteobacteria bacterium]